jgi:signal transduction histidine kinase
MGSLARQVLATADAERRRLERALHDGAQQRVAAVAATLALAQRRLEAGDDGARELVDQAAEEVGRCLEDLRQLARDIYPAVLSECGLASALNDLARRAPVPVEVTAAPDRGLPEAVELAAYLVVSEALCNLGEDSKATLSAEVRDRELTVEVHGAALGAGQAERLANRVEALGGRLGARAEVGEKPVVRAVVPVGAVANGTRRA